MREGCNKNLQSRACPGHDILGLEAWLVIANCHYLTRIRLSPHPPRPCSAAHQKAHKCASSLPYPAGGHCLFSHGCCARPSAPTWGLPSCSVDCVKSRTSSTIWNARPKCLPYSNIASFTSSLALQEGTQISRSGRSSQQVESSGSTGHNSQLKHVHPGTLARLCMAPAFAPLLTKQAHPLSTAADRQLAAMSDAVL